MYNRFQLAGKYLSYYLNACNSKGHGVHSPFVYNFIEQVLNDQTPYEEYRLPEQLRKSLLKNSHTVRVDDFGAGSSVLPVKNRRIKDIAASSLKPAKFSQLLYRIVKYYNCKSVVEMGTSLGVTTCYLASAAEEVITMEGAPAIARIAKENFQRASLHNIRLIEGHFAATLPDVLQTKAAKKPDLLFVDGNHRKEPTIDYFKKFLPLKHDRTIFIFDDIHWSGEMESAWEEIRSHPAVTLSIDLFFIGLIFFNPDFKVKQHFRIRF